jgi:5-formyltetrahydrofolate cyclo-ligase
MTKIELRQINLARRRALSPEEAAVKSRRIAFNFFEGFDLSGTKLLHCFIPIKKFNEVDTSLIIRALWATTPDMITVAPRIVAGTGEMEGYVYSAESGLTQNAFGISEPAAGDPVDPEMIDVVVVPGLVFDKSGHRVGYGKGFYDRFLARCRTDCRKIGVEYFEPVDEISDIHEGDVAVDACVTPEGIFARNKRRVED